MPFWLLHRAVFMWIWDRKESCTAIPYQCLKASTYVKTQFNNFLNEQVMTTHDSLLLLRARVGDMCCGVHYTTCHHCVLFQKNDICCTTVINSKYTRRFANLSLSILSEEKAMRVHSSITYTPRFHSLRILLLVENTLKISYIIFYLSCYWIWILYICSYCSLTNKVLLIAVCIYFLSYPFNKFTLKKITIINK